MKFSPEKFKKLRLRRNVTQNSLAARCGVSRQTVSNWEAGISAPKPCQAGLICEYFSVPVSEITTGAPEYVETVVTDDIDVSKLNPDGVKALTNMYDFLLSQEKYTKIKW